MSARVVRSIMVAVLATGTFVACSEDPRLLDPTPPSFLISDGAHNGNEHFYFLPPMVKNPQTSGTFDPTLSPVIEIVDLDDGVTIATLSADKDNSNSHYHQNWHTDDYNLDETHTYRIRVLVDGTELGFADVDVVTSGSQLKNVNTNEYIALKDGRTLPIMFRIEEGALGGGSGFFAVETESPEDPAPRGTLTFSICDGGVCDPDAEAFPFNTFGTPVTFEVAPGDWDYEIVYTPADSDDFCELDEDESSTLSAQDVPVAAGETVSLSFLVNCIAF